MKLFYYTADQLRDGQTVLVPQGWEIVGAEVRDNNSLVAIGMREVPKGQGSAVQSRSVARAERRES